MLKFPSVYWRAYSRKGEPPQLGFWQRMQQDPRGLVQQVSVDFVMTYSRQYRQSGVVGTRVAWRDLGAGWRRLALFSRSALLNRYGRDRRPLSVVLPRQFRHARQVIRERRGLAP